MQKGPTVYSVPALKEMPSIKELQDFHVHNDQEGLLRNQLSPSVSHAWQPFSVVFALKIQLVLELVGNFPRTGKQEA